MKAGAPRALAAAPEVFVQQGAGGAQAVRDGVAQGWLQLDAGLRQVAVHHL